MRKKIGIAGVFACICLCLTACTHKESRINENGQTNVSLVLDWTPNTNHTGIYVAQQQGFFEEEGLNVSILQPPDNGATDLVASGGADFGIDFQDTLAAAFASDNPLPVTAVAALVQHNTSGIISLQEKQITSPKKLEGHTYATWESPIEQKMLEYVVRKDGGDFSKVKLISATVEDSIAALHADIDSIWIYYGWDGIKCKQAGVDTGFLSFREMDETFDYYSPVLIGNTNFLKEHPDVAKAFLRGVKKGYEYCVQYPKEAANCLCDAVPELDKALVMDSQEYMSQQYIADAKQFGIIDPERWNRFYRWLNENHLVEKTLSDNTGFTNQYLEL